MSKGSWTGGRRRKKINRPDYPKTLVVSDASFFLRRTKHNEIPPEGSQEWSELMVRQAAKKWPQVIIFELASQYPTPTSMEGFSSLEAFVDSLDVSNVKVITYEQQELDKVTAFWKECLVELGAKIKPARNPREVTYLNLDKWIDAPHITWAGQNGHKQAKIEIDKPATFEELQKKRKKKAKW
jgi:hypothetical protein